MSWHGSYPQYQPAHALPSPLPPLKCAGIPDAELTPHQRGHIKVRRRNLDRLDRGIIAGLLVYPLAYAQRRAKALHKAADKYQARGYEKATARRRARAVEFERAARFMELIADSDISQIRVWLDALEIPRAVG